VLIPTFYEDYTHGNDYVGRLVQRYPQRFLGFAFVHPERDAGRIGGLVGQAVRRWGLCGIKVHQHDGPATDEVCRVARAWRLPLLYDVMGQTEWIDQLAPRYPTVNFIIPHLGSFADKWQAQQRVVEQLVTYPNVYTDTAGVRRFDYIVQAVTRAGAHKVLFGSDGPWLHPGVELHKIRLLGLPPAQEALILGGNLWRLIGRGAGSRGKTALPQEQGMRIAQRI
jgi:predicted TIM-barrel fold metal-dependent hydrolase